MLSPDFTPKRGKIKEIWGQQRSEDRSVTVGVFFNNLEYVGATISS